MQREGERRKEGAGGGEAMKQDRDQTDEGRRKEMEGKRDVI